LFLFFLAIFANKGRCTVYCTIWTSAYNVIQHTTAILRNLTLRGILKLCDQRNKTKCSREARIVLEPLRNAREALKEFASIFLSKTLHMNFGQKNELIKLL